MALLSSLSSVPALSVWISPSHSMTTVEDHGHPPIACTMEIPVFPGALLPWYLLM